MTPPGAGENGITPDPPQGLRSLRAVEPAEADPAPHTPKRPPHNLPLELSSFVGREREMAEIKELLADHRLLTLTGPGGCGKTRLALAVARDVVGHASAILFHDPELLGTHSVPRSEGLWPRMKALASGTSAEAVVAAVVAESPQQPEPPQQPEASANSSW
jgi:AAA ATPase-like protein